MENEEKPHPHTNAETTPGISLEQQVHDLHDSMEKLTSELQTVRRDLESRKRENTTLKILFYTGLIVLLLGFLYTNTTLQRAQLQSVEASINSLQNFMNRELVLVEKSLYKEIKRLENRMVEYTDTDLKSALERVNRAISRLEPADEKTARLIARIRRQSEDLLAAYQSEKPAVSQKKNPPLSNTSGE